MKLLDKACGIFKKQGLRGFCYIAVQKLKNGRSEQQKYARYVRQSQKRHRICIDPVYAFADQFALLHVDEEIFSAIEEATAPYLVFVEDGAVPSENWQALAGAYLQRHPACRFLYTDEEICKKGGGRIPVWKPDWSPDTYLSYDYISGLMILERALAVETKEEIHSKFRQTFLYELGLRAAAHIQPSEIGHLDEVLCHRAERAPLPKEQLLALKEALLHERGAKGYVRWCEDAQAAQVVYLPEKEPLVSIIVPSKDHAELLKTCILSVEALTAYAQVEWIVVDNGSSGTQKAKYEALCAGTRYPCTYLYTPMEFNFSRMCNIGAQAAHGSCLLFLNDDMELPKAWESMHGLTARTQADWLSVLAGQALQPRTGAVGAKLLYPQSDLIQHLGVVNYTSGAAHLLWQAPDREDLWKRNLVAHNYSVVTGACLMVAAEKFAQVGGFEESLTVTFNDVALCLQLSEAGYYNVVRPDVVLYHHESLSRGQDVLDEKKFLRSLKERERLFDLHPERIGVDPFYSRHLTQTRLDHMQDDPGRLVYAKKLRGSKTAVRAAMENAYAPAETQIRARILRVRCELELTIEGWAYRPGHGSERVIVHLIDADGNDSAYETQAVYAPTLQTEQQQPKRLNFSEFMLRLPSKSIEKGTYTLVLQIQDCCRRMRRIEI